MLEEQLDRLLAGIDVVLAERRELIAAAKQALAYVDSLSIGNAATARLRVAVARAEERQDG